MPGAEGNRLRVRCEFIVNERKREIAKFKCVCVVKKMVDIAYFVRFMPEKFCDLSTDLDHSGRALFFLCLIVTFF
ncbi:hypothetical protein MA13_contig00006-0029 [Edwardsiella piscicida]|nr:hypothetical protein MA13_contig00006-0029 [Edwardsiella piscicida]